MSHLGKSLNYCQLKEIHPLDSRSMSHCDNQLSHPRLRVAVSVIERKSLNLGSLQTFTIISGPDGCRTPVAPFSHHCRTPVAPPDFGDEIIRF